MVLRPATPTPRGPRVLRQRYTPSIGTGALRLDLSRERPGKAVLEHRAAFPCTITSEDARPAWPRSIAAFALAACTGVFFSADNRHRVTAPSELGLAYQEVTFKDPGRARVAGLAAPGERPRSGHGLAVARQCGKHQHPFREPRLDARARLHVFIFDYRGYGASEGTPSLEGAQLDIDAAMQTLLARADIDKDRIVSTGQSLGGALGAYYVAHSTYRGRIRALVIESAFSGYVEIALEQFADHWITWPFQWLPYLTVDDRFSPLPVMAQISTIPLLVLHGDQDRSVPAQHGMRLYEAALGPSSCGSFPAPGTSRP